MQYTSDTQRPGNGGVSGGYYFVELKIKNVELRKRWLGYFSILNFQFSISLRNSQAHSATALAPASHHIAGSLGGAEAAYSS
jgi:hypothetical protein